MTIFFIYLCSLVLIGLYFTRNSSVDDFFRGGQRYMAVADENRAARATWINALVSIPATFSQLSVFLFVLLRVMS